MREDSRQMQCEERTEGCPLESIRNDVEKAGGKALENRCQVKMVGGSFMGKPMEVGDGHGIPGKAQDVQIDTMQTILALI